MTTGFMLIGIQEKIFVKWISVLVDVKTSGGY